MKTTYCDFCGNVVEDATGDIVHLGEPECYPEGKLDACSRCFTLLWVLVRSKSLPALGDRIAPSASCPWCAEGNPRVESSVNPGKGIFVHTDTSIGRVVCRQPTNAAIQEES